MMNYKGAVYKCKNNHISLFLDSKPKKVICKICGEKMILIGPQVMTKEKKDDKSGE
jgi:hypothetical protein